MSKPTRLPVLFIHGLWLHPDSWQPWQDRFAVAGYDTLAPGWPGVAATVAETRAHPERLADVTINQAAEHYAGIIAGLPVRPVVIGHSFGGLLALKLLDHQLAAAVVAIDPVPIQGVLRLPPRQLRATWPALGRPWRRHQALSLSPGQFTYAFANRLTGVESADLYRTAVIPAPTRPFWQAAVANWMLRAETKVDVRQPGQPLLLMAGGQDHAVPASTTRALWRRYRRPMSATDLKQWPDRGHSLVIDDGWSELADYTLEWLRTQGLTAEAVAPARHVRAEKR